MAAAACLGIRLCLRYGEGREGITGHPFTPWHYRYVGVEAAKQIVELNITFEDYLTIFYG